MDKIINRPTESSKMMEDSIKIFTDKSLQDLKNIQYSVNQIQSTIKESIEQITDFNKYKKRGKQVI